MPNITRSKKQQEQDDLKLAKKLKPRLRKFVIDEQTKRAKTNVTAEQDKLAKLAALETLTKDVIKQAQKLSQIAFLQDRLWVAHPPVVEMTWLSATGASPELEAEQRQDMWAFARYLVKEYFGNYQAQQNTQQGYLSPLDRKNLPFFWQKFNTDLSLAVMADLRRIKAGN